MFNAKLVNKICFFLKRFILQNQRDEGNSIIIFLKIFWIKDIISKNTYIKTKCKLKCFVFSKQKW